MTESTEVKTDLSDEQIRMLREKTLTAVATGLGSDPLLIPIITRGLVSCAGELAHIDYSKQRGKTDPDHVRDIEAIGTLLLTGAPSVMQGLKYPVGCFTLALTQEDPTAPNTQWSKNAEGWVGLWTDGDGVPKFREVINQPLPTNSS